MKRIFALMALAFGFLPQAWSQGNGVTADLSLNANEYLAGEDLPVKVHIANLSGQDILLGREDDWITFTITKDKTTTVSQLKEMVVTNEFTLQSAQGANCSFNLTPYFDFRSPGFYTVKATIRIAQWHQEVACRPTNFTIITGVRLSNLPDLLAGIPLPPGVSNTPPEIRRYILQKVISTTGMNLYLQVTDAGAARIFKALSLGPMTSFGDPEVQIDRYSNLHVLHQNGARLFGYHVVNPLGQILDRQTYEITDTRPVLREDSDGGVTVKGGTRRFSASDLPPPVSQASVSATLPNGNKINSTQP